MKKRYIIRKYVEASTAKEALRKEKDHPADECWVDEKWMEQSTIRGFDKK
jgi:hypothetical protein